MNKAHELPDPRRARAYFEAKTQFTLGPAELEELRKQRGDDVVIIDVRSTDAFAKAHVPGALNLPLARWDAAEGVSQDRLNVFYCYSQVCHLAAKAAARFAARGYPVMELEGGFTAWQEQHLPVESGSGETAHATPPPEERFIPTY